MRKLSVLVIHNQYQQPGGEDVAVQAEVDLLRLAGHRVVRFTQNNAVLANYTRLQKAALFFTTTWNRTAYSKIRDLIDKERPDIVHCHNLLPQVSPAAYYACKSAGVPVVQTLHNYRLFCPAGTFFHNGRICKDCTRSLSYSLKQGCYRDSRSQSATVAMMLAFHRHRETWTRSVDAYIALTQFSRDFFVALGLPDKKVHVKPNFVVQDPVPHSAPGTYALFVGRLSPEKGVLEMLRTWLHLPHIPLVVVGDGPVHEAASQIVRRSGSTDIKLMGRMSKEDTQAQMRGARFLIFPSRWYEPFGMALIEAAAVGVPAIAARIAGIPELVVEKETGLLFDLQKDDLAAKANWAWTHPAAMEVMGVAARQLYQRNFTAEKNYESLINVYRSVMSNGSPANA
ncbi:MAG: glycosyltransferase family 4 protein [Candidatus Korobacteraceae bacterium]